MIETRTRTRVVLHVEVTVDEWARLRDVLNKLQKVQLYTMGLTPEKLCDGALVVGITDEDGEVSRSQR